jgi:hypothetical protein
MASLAELQTRRDQLEAAVQSGVASITVDGQTTNFANMRDVRAILNDVIHQITVLESGTQSRPRHASFSLTRGV